MVILSSSQGPPASQAWGNRPLAPPDPRPSLPRPPPPPFPFSLCSSLNVFLWAIGGEQRRQPGKPGPSLTSSVRHLSRAAGTPMCWHSFQHMSFFIPHASHLRMRMCAGAPPDTPWAGAGSKEEAAWLLPNKEGRKTKGSAWNLKLGREIQIELLFPEHTSANPIWLSCPLTPCSSPTDQEFYRGSGVWHSSGD